MIYGGTITVSTINKSKCAARGNQLLGPSSPSLLIIDDNNGFAIQGVVIVQGTNDMDDCMTLSLLLITALAFASNKWLCNDTRRNKSLALGGVMRSSQHC